MTSQSTSRLDAPGGSPARESLRLRLSGSPAAGVLDGGWWPQSRDIDVELADLADHFPPEVGRVHRVLYSRPDWDTHPRSVRVARGGLKTGSFPSDDTNVVVLSMSTHERLKLLVIPPDHPAPEQALTMAADPANRHSTAEILAGRS
jgi:hypothetical protein